MPAGVRQAVTAHALDRFSQRFIAKWLTERFRVAPAEAGGEGFASYVARHAAGAWDHGNQFWAGRDAAGRSIVKRHHRDIVWVFSVDADLPVLVSVLHPRDQEKDD